MDVREEINAIHTEVAAQTSVRQSALTLLERLAVVIGWLRQLLGAAASSGDPAQMQEALQQVATAEQLLGANAGSLCDAVMANTGAAEPAVEQAAQPAGPAEAGEQAGAGGIAGVDEGAGQQ